MSIQGDGYHPGHDPFGRRFDGGYHPEMAAVAGTEILPGYRAILEGIQCDQEYAKCIFGLNHFYNRKQCCHYCGVIQWTSRVPAVGEPNDPNDLYTNFSADEHRKKQFLDWYTWSIIISFFFRNVDILKPIIFPHWTPWFARIVDLPTFIQLHGQSALCRVIGFSPDSILTRILFANLGHNQLTCFQLFLFAPQKETFLWKNKTCPGSNVFIEAIPTYPKYGSPWSNQGILPDVMHICHLSLYPDAFCSVLLDLSDDQTFIRGGSRDARLSQLWLSYRQWCEDGGHYSNVFFPTSNTLLTMFKIGSLFNMVVPCKVCKTEHPKDYSWRKPFYPDQGNFQNLHRKWFRLLLPDTLSFGLAIWWTKSWDNGVTTPLSTWCASYWNK